MNEDAGVVEARLARVADDNAARVDDGLLAVAIEADASDIALMEEAGRLCLDGDRTAKRPMSGDSIRLRVSDTDLGHRDPGCGERIMDAHQSPIVNQDTRCMLATWIRRRCLPLTCNRLRR